MRRPRIGAPILLGAPGHEAVTSAPRRQPDAEKASPPDLALDFHGSLVQLNQVLDDRETESRSRPALGSGAVDLVEALKDLFSFCTRDSRAVVRNGEPRPARPALGAEADRFSFG